MQELRARRATGALMARLREELGWTQHDLAQRAKVPVGRIAAWERGAGLMFAELQQLRALGEALGTTAGQLVDAGTDSPPERPSTPTAGIDTAPGADSRLRS